MVDFIAEVLGEDAEVVLHDVSDIDKSIVAIRNSHISRRGVGAPATNLALKILKDGKYGEQDYITNYRGVSESGKILKSSTYFIRDNDKRIIGMFCINIDFEKLSKFRDYLNGIVDFSPKNNDEKTLERFSTSVEEVAYESIDLAIKNFGITPERMTQDEKIEIIKELNNNGVFLLKGSVSEVASQLKVSEPTIYRYLNIIKKE